MMATEASAQPPVMAKDEADRAHQGIVFGKAADDEFRPHGLRRLVAADERVLLVGGDERGQQQIAGERPSPGNDEHRRD